MSTQIRSQIMRVPTLSSRRVWGTGALAITNLCAAFVLLDPESMRGARIHTIALRMMPVWVWGVAFLIAGVGLAAGAVLRSLGVVHAFGVLSIMSWTALTVGAFVSAFTVDGVTLSGLAVALFAWMFLGPISMLLVPLIYNHRLRKELER